MTANEIFRFLNALKPGMVEDFIQRRQVGRPGVLVFGDFGTHEVRLAAFLCKDPTMIKALDIGFHDLNLAGLEKLIAPRDVPNATRALRDELVDKIQKRYLKQLAPELPEAIYEYSYQDILKKLSSVKEYEDLVNRWKALFKKKRTVAKESTFGPLYGMKPPTFAAAQGITKEEAEEVFRIDRETYPLKHAWAAEEKAKMRKNGYVQSIFGKKRRLDYSACNSDGEIEQLDRQGINSLVQGPSSDLGFLCMWECIQTFKREKIHAKAIGTIHDSLGHDSHPDCYEEVLEITFNVMENHPTKLLGSDHVKFKAEMEYMKDWGHPKPWEPDNIPM